MNILVSCDENYINPLKTMLYSLFKSNDRQIEIYLIHKDIRDEKIREIEKFVEKASLGKGRLNSIKVEIFFQKLKQLSITQKKCIIDFWHTNTCQKV